jgi:nonsense-mediated mRNA decay protein 3
VEEIVLTAAEEHLKLHSAAENPSIQLSLSPLGRSTFKVHIRAKAAVFRHPITYDSVLEVRLRFETCDVCSRLAGGYYEAIIQLRGDSRLLEEGEIAQYTEKIQNLLEQIRERGNRLAFIAKTVRLKEGVDFYLGSNKAARQICQKIVEAHAATFTQSPKLVGRRDGVDVHRVTYSLRLPRFKEGDVIRCEEEVFQVTGRGKLLHAVNLAKGISVVLDRQKVKHARKIAEMKDAKVAIVVSSDEATVQILDPDTYRTLTLKRPPFMGDEPEVKIIKTDSEILIIK